MAAPVLRRPSVLRSGSRHPQDGWQVAGNEIRSHPPGRLRLEHQPLEWPQQAHAQLVRDRAGTARSEHLPEPAILDLRGDHRQQQLGESVPGIGCAEGYIDGRLQLVQPLCERGVDQRLLAWEVPVERPHADPGTVRDQVNRDPQPPLGK